MTTASKAKAHQLVGGDLSTLTAHTLTLAQQASDQASGLSTALATHVFLDSMFEPEKTDDRESLFPSVPQLMVLKHALNTELQRQVTALTSTTDALRACAAAVGDASAPPEHT